MKTTRWSINGNLFMGVLAISDHFSDVGKMVPIDSGVERKIDDKAFSKYACYPVVQNGDPGKAELDFAQTYFAVQTRKQEIIEQRLLDLESVYAKDVTYYEEFKLSFIGMLLFVE